MGSLLHVTFPSMGRVCTTRVIVGVYLVLTPVGSVVHPPEPVPSVRSLSAAAAFDIVQVI